MIRKTLLAVALAGLALQAQAAPVVVDFSTDGFDGGSLFGQLLTGQFSYDDATLDASTDWLTLTSFSFTVGGQSYTLSDDELAGGAAVFTAGLLTGVDAVHFGPGAFDFSFSSGFGAPYAFYENPTADEPDFGFANISFQPTATVPEPASYALVLAALGGGLFARRRKA